MSNDRLQGEQKRKRQNELSEKRTYKTEKHGEGNNSHIEADRKTGQTGSIAKHPPQVCTLHPNIEATTPSSCVVMTKLDLKLPSRAPS